jgi:hypothetical protein
MTIYFIPVVTVVHHKYVMEVDSDLPLCTVEEIIRGINPRNLRSSYDLARAIDNVVSGDGDQAGGKEYETEVEGIYIEGDKQ